MPMTVACLEQGHTKLRRNAKFQDIKFGITLKLKKCSEDLYGKLLLASKENLVGEIAYARDSKFWQDIVYTNINMMNKYDKAHIVYTRHRSTIVRVDSR